MKLVIELSHDEVCNEIPFGIIAETTARSVWDSGRRKRLWKHEFSEAERAACSRIRQQATMWALVRGVPSNGVRMSVNTYNLWLKLADFCACL